MLTFIIIIFQGTELLNTNYRVYTFIYAFAINCMAPRSKI